MISNRLPAYAQANSLLNHNTLSAPFTWPQLANTKANTSLAAPLIVADILVRSMCILNNLYLEANLSIGLSIYGPNVY
jgi:hypothetical protein